MSFNKYLIPAGLTLLLAVAGCENDGAPSEEKGYLCEGENCGGGGLGGESGELPDSDADDCLDKGAAGAMKLLFKGGTNSLDSGCGDIKPAECGNNNLDAGEECEPPGVDNCGTDCMKIGEDMGDGDGDNSVISIVTTAIEDGKIGDNYESKSITANGKNASDSYVWSAVSLPSGFEMVPSGNQAVKIASTGPAQFGDKSATLRACLKSDASVCAEKSFSFKIKDELTLKAYKYASSKVLCDDDDTSCSLTIKPEDTLFDLVKTPGSDYKYLLSFKVTGLDLSNKSYQWSFSYKKNNQTIIIKPAPVLDLPVNSGLYSYPYLNDVSGHYLVFGTSAYGKAIKDVVITVKNNLGGVQKLIFPEIKIASKAEIQAALAAQQTATQQAAQTQAEKCNNLMVKDILIENENRALTCSTKNNVKTCSADLDDSNTDYILYTSKPYNGELNIIGGTGSYTISNVSYGYYINNPLLLTVNPLPQPPTPAETAMQWPVFIVGSQNVTGTDTTEFDVSDDSSACKQTIHVEIKRSLHLPNYNQLKIKDVKLFAKFGSEWTDGDSKIKFDLLDGQGNLLATTNNQGIDGVDPTCFNKFFILTPETNKGDLSISDIASVKVGITDQTYCTWYYCEKNMKFHFKYLRLEAGDTWYAESNESWNTNIENGWKYKTFTLENNSSNESMWFYGKLPIPDNTDDIPDQDCDEWKN